MLLFHLRMPATSTVAQDQYTRDAIGVRHMPPDITVREIVARLGDLALPGDGFASGIAQIQARQRPVDLPVECPTTFDLVST